MRIICSGGAGFIGSHVVDQLLREGNSVLVLDNFSTGKMDNLAGYALEHKKLLIHECDIRQLPVLIGVCANWKPDAVIHLAAQSAITTALENPVKDIMTNAVGTLNMLEAARKAGAKRFVFSSTSAVYKNSRKKLREEAIQEPTNPYGISKLAAEAYIRLFWPDYVILRYGNVYGPRQVPIGENQVIARMIKHFKFGDPFYIHGDGNQKRDFVYVKDVAEATVSALRGKAGVYNIASGESFSVNEIARFVADDYSISNYPWDYDEEVDDRGNVQMDIRAAQKSLSWQPAMPIRDGIRETIAWWGA